MIPPENILEEVVSGETIEKRPLFQQELAEWEAGRPRAAVLYVVEISRLSRGSLAQAARIMEALRKARVRIRTPHRWYDLNAGDDNFTYGLLALLSHRENEVYKERVELKRVEQVRTGQLLTGKPPWGFSWDRNVPGQRGRLVPHPERFPKLQAICREVLTQSLHRLSLVYGVPVSVLAVTLRNPTIAGWPARRHIAGHPQQPPRELSAPLPRAAWVWPEQPGTYPAACTLAEWEAIQVVLDQRWCLKGKTGFDAEGWARDVIRFNEDPTPARLASARGFLLYERGGGRAHELLVARAVVHSTVYETLRQVFSTPAVLMHALAAREEREPADDGTAAAAAGLSRLRAALDRATEDQLGMEDTEARASLARVRQKLLTDIRHVQAELTRLQHARPAPALAALPEAVLSALGQAFPSAWPQLTGEEKRQLVNTLIACVPVRVWLPEGKVRHRREVGEPVLQAWLDQSR